MEEKNKTDEERLNDICREVEIVEDRGNEGIRHFKDNICGSLRAQNDGGHKMVVEPIIYDDYNSRIRKDQDTIGTLTCNIGSPTPRNGYKIIEKTVGVSVHPFGRKLEFKGEKSIKEVSPTLRATDYKCPHCVWERENVQDYHIIRKLTPRECFRLMGVNEENIDKIQSAGISNSQQYKLAGNSIVVDVMEAIFINLFMGSERVRKDTLF